MRIPIESSTSYRGRNSRPNWFMLMLIVGLGFSAGAVGAFFAPGVSASSTAWYAGLIKPIFTPPNRIFGPVWTGLYLLMGIAAWLVWSERYHRNRGMALSAFFLQLLLNALWAPLFFGLKNPGAGLFVIVTLWLTIVWAIREFFSVNKAAGVLMLPYLLWVSFAVALNLSIWRLNP